MTQPPASRDDALRGLFAGKIAVLGGALGPMVRARRLEEADFRGRVLPEHPLSLKGNYDLLALTRPDLIEQIHADYFAAGADLVETHTFSSNALRLAAYRCEPFVREINLAAVACARRAAESAAKKLGRACFVVGAIGPVNPSDHHAVAHDRMVAAYAEQVEALLDGGADALRVDTALGGLASHPALVAIDQVRARRGNAARLPVMIRARLATHVAERSIAEFLASVGPTRPFVVGVHGTLDGDALRTWVQALARTADCHVACSFADGSGTRADLARTLGEFARNGWLNLVDGGHDATPAHIAALAAAVKGLAPRPLPQAARALRLSGLTPSAVA